MRGGQGGHVIRHTKLVTHWLQTMASDATEAYPQTYPQQELNMAHNITLKTYREARDLIPTDAKWSSTFGNPGEGGYTEYYRRPSGQRWMLSNGPWHLLPWEFDWQAKPVDGA